MSKARTIRNFKWHRLKTSLETLFSLVSRYFFQPLLHPLLTENLFYFFFGQSAFKLTAIIFAPTEII